MLNVLQSGLSHMEHAFDELQVNVMMCDLKNFTIFYANKAAKDTLRTIEHALPITVDELIGSSIDVFHKNPEHQRAMLRNPNNLPHHAVINIGGEYLDLTITAHYSGGRYQGPIVSWILVTDRVKAEKNVSLMRQMLDQMPVNAMICNAETFIIDYANQTSIDTLEAVRDHIPIDPQELVGSSVDVFHKHPEHQRRILGDPSNLPFHSKIRLGPEVLDLRINPLFNDDGVYTHALLTWSVATKFVNLSDTFEANVKSVVDQVSSASTELNATSETMAAAAEEASTQASTVAAATEQLTMSANEIGLQTNRAREITSDAVAQAEISQKGVNRLAELAQSVDAVVNLINDIAEQTNLLALNATIEAARAGDAGKGFAVVANEVKLLASQTAKATDEIAGQIGAIQSETKGAVDAITTITNVVREVNEISQGIAAAVDEQNAALQEVTGNISGVSEAASETGAAASQTLQASGELSQQAEILRKEVDGFLVEVREL